MMECGVCFQEVRVMKTLPCKHGFCVLCVDNLVKFSPDDFLKCPMCRQEVEDVDSLTLLFTGRMKCGVCSQDFPTEDIFWFRPSAKLLCRGCTGELEGEVYEWNSLRAVDDCCRFFKQLETIPPIPRISLCQKLQELYNKYLLEENHDNFDFDVKSFDNYLSVAREVVKVATEEENFKKIWNNFDRSFASSAGLKRGRQTELLRGPLVEPIPTCHLVNPAGYNISSGSSKKGSFYCSRYLSNTRIGGSDGMCGPDEGRQCPDCKAFFPLNSAGVPVKSFLISDTENNVKFFCNMEIGQDVCCKYSNFQCEYCKEFDKNPVQAMAKGIYWRLKRGLILTNAALDFVEFDKLATLPYCGVETVSKFYGQQKCEKDDRCFACKNAVFLNSAGFPVKPGTEEGTKDRFYCGRYLNREALPMTDGFCGPNNGPQCADCQEFQANPCQSMEKGFRSLLFLLQYEQPLVNRAGYPVTAGTDLLYSETGCGYFYCGRYVGAAALPGSDGRCGSNNGPQCDDCKEFCPRNEAGVPVKPGRDRECIDLFYCGRRLGVNRIPGSDGRCGPSNGPQCPECENFQKNPGLAMRKGLLAKNKQKQVRK